MKDIFVDTSGWASFLVSSERFHIQAFAVIHNARRERRRIVTSNYILAELSALLVSPLRLPHEIRLTTLERIRTAAWIEIVHVDRDSDSQSWEYMTGHRDKDYSLVDCSSFVIMKRSGLSDALTEDRHFEQAGFNRLLNNRAKIL